MFKNNLDITNRVDTTEPQEVKREVDRLFKALYPGANAAAVDTAFYDAERIYRGELPGFRACDTAYHDIQHVLEVTLAMARLVDGYERSCVNAQPLGSKLFQLGVIVALFHDVGYIRAADDAVASNGAEYTLIHVSRGSQFLREYLPRIGMADIAAIAAELIHFTGYERPVKSIAVPDLRYRLLGNLLGTADIIAQMADRCYLEKCRDRLYPEFVAGNVARKTTADGKEVVVFDSPEDLLKKTPGFYSGAMRRLSDDLGNGVNYAAAHFGGQNLYLEEVEKNIRFAEEVSKDNKFSLLKRVPPETLRGAENSQVKE